MDVVQASLLGSILSNLLFVLGFCFLCGGLKFKTQHFNKTAAGTSASILTLAVLGFLLPAAFVQQLSDVEPVRREELLLELSHGTAIILLLVYLMFLYFQLKSHSNLYEDNNNNVTGSLLDPISRRNITGNTRGQVSEDSVEIVPSNFAENDEEEETTMTLYFAIGLLITVTVLVSINAEYLVGSIEGLSEQWKLSPSFVGLILLPIVGNAAEHVTAVTVAMKSKFFLFLYLSFCNILSSSFLAESDLLSFSSIPS